MRKKRPLKRVDGVHRDATMIVIASEDRYAVKQYFDFFKSTQIQFRVLETEDCNSAPEQVMLRLDAFMKDHDFGEGDQFWFVADTDHWIESNHIQNLVEVVRLCRQKGIGVALSNPCFELWLLLHFAEFPKQDASCSQLGDQIRKVVGSYNKTKVFNLPITNAGVAEAIRRSKANFTQSDTIPDHPQTAVHLIIGSLVEQGVVKILE
ncbi:MAG: RloB family protein [Rubripirellula sp.]